MVAANWLLLDRVGRPQHGGRRRARRQQAKVERGFRAFTPAAGWCSADGTPDILAYPRTAPAGAVSAACSRRPICATEKGDCILSSATTCSNGATLLSLAVCRDLWRDADRTLFHNIVQRARTVSAPCGLAASPCSTGGRVRAGWRLACARARGSAADRDQ